MSLFEPETNWYFATTKYVLPTVSGVARQVMERLPHVLLVGDGASRFAAEIGAERRVMLSPEAATAWAQRMQELQRDTAHFRYTIHLANRPEAQAFVESIRSTLAGNRKALEQDYTLALEGESQRWVLTLVPRDETILALLKRITVSGSRNQVRHIEYLQADGDRSEISIDPIEVQ